MTATDTEAALLAAIRENPGEDAPRLVWADWLEENAGTVACGACKGEGKIGVGNNGNPYMAKCDECNGSACVSDGRAELADFIRVQVELAAEHSDCGAKGYGPCGERCEALRRREDELAVEIDSAFGELPLYWSTDQIPISHGIIVRRGLPALVRSTLAEWMGGECATCGGTRLVHYRPPRGTNYDAMGSVENCPSCQGTGRTPGIGPRLAQRWPVVEVQATDKRPLGTNSSGGIRWTNESEHSWGLPEEIFKRLPTGPTCTMIRDAGESWASRISARDYESEPAARAALSGAMLAWARSQPIEDGRS